MTVIEHSGTKGMHWGEQNYQTADGTWTALGLKRRREREGSGTAATKKKTGWFAKRAKTTEPKAHAEENDDAQLSLEEKKAKHRKSAKDLYKHRDLYDDNELQTAKNRLSLEQSIKDMVPKDKNKVEVFIDGMVKAANTTTKIMAAGEKLYNQAQSLEQLIEFASTGKVSKKTYKQYLTENGIGVKKGKDKKED